MITKNNEQIQIRIDAETKKEAKKILDSLGIDMSSAIKLFFRQIINARNLPFELRGENGLTLQNAELLRESIISARNSTKIFKDGSVLIKDALRD
ncbi:MAG: type II toxin-antitoxin system RelB/DinJ family antitoxin [Clostridia bacterium]|nr:type II toxin-antitoxin system RelB/DinJ family antitoxin [Clostridia bacterium]